MKIQCDVSVVVLAKVENEYQGNKYFNLTVFNDPEAGSLKCNADVYSAVQVGKPNKLVCEFNDKTNTFRAISVKDIK